MAHSTSKVLMGSTGSSEKVVTNGKAAAVIEAGIRVCLKSDDTLSIAVADGVAIGISLGKDLSDTTRTAICRSGLKVPMKLTTAFDPVIGAQVHISDTTGLAGTAGAGFTGVNAVYSSGRIGGTGVTGGIAEGATTDTGSVGVALIDFPGGL